MASPKELPAPRMPKGFSVEDFIYSKLFKCVNKIGQNVMCEVVRTMYSHSSVNSNGGNKTLRQYFADGGVSKRSVKDSFTKLHSHLLDEDLNHIDFDISFACAVMTEACKDLYNQLSAMEKSSVEELRKMRNRICHNYGINSNELSPIIDNLKNILKVIYLGVGSVVNKDFSDSITSMESNIQSIISSQVQQVHLDTYAEDVQRFKTDLKFMMIDKGKREFHSSYSKLRILNPCIWMTQDAINKTPLIKYQVDTIFTPLKIESRKNNIEIADIFTVPMNVKGKNKKPSALLMFGLAGCGKTSLCHYIIHDWCKKESDREVFDLDFDLIIFVEVRRARSKTLIEFLREECMVGTCKYFESGDIIPTLKDLDILVVVDGFDEAKKDMSRELIKDIFCKLQGQRILLTTRPEYKEDAFHLSRRFEVSYLPIEICGFDEKGLKTFSEKVFRAVEGDESRCKKELESFLRYMDTTGHVLDAHLKLPLTLALLIYLWREDSSVVFKIKSATMLYLEIFKLCQKRLCERLENIGRKSLDEKLNQILFCLGQQAWSLLLERDLLCLTRNEFGNLADECRKKSVDVLEVLSTYLYCETAEDEDTKDRIFGFLHKTQMEYLAGAYLANSITFANYKGLTFDEINKEVEEKNEWKNLSEVIKYMTGSLAITGTLERHYVSEIFEILDEAHISFQDFNFWWSFYLETLKSDLASSKIVKKLAKSWRLNKNQVVSGLKIYRDCGIELETLEIDISTDVEPYDIKELLPTLEEIRDKKTKLKVGNKMKPVKTELHLWNHEHYHSKPSDDLVLSLNPWCQLTNFTGCLEQDVLNANHKLKTICVRLNTVDAVMAFKQCLNRNKFLNTLRVTLGVPFSCSPSELCNFEYPGIELTLKETKDDHGEWIAATVKQINGKYGCSKLFLLNTEISYGTISYLLRKLKNYVQEISLDPINQPTNDQKEKLKKQEIKTQIRLVWVP